MASTFFKDGLADLVMPITKMMPAYKEESVVDDEELSDKSNPIVEKTTVTKGADGSEVKVTKRGVFDKSIVSDNVVPIADKKVIDDKYNVVTSGNTPLIRVDKNILDTWTPDIETIYGDPNLDANLVDNNEDVGVDPFAINAYREQERRNLLKGSPINVESPEVSTEYLDKWKALQENPDGKMISDAMLKDPNIAKEILANPVRMQKDYGADLAGDLFSIAVGALTGNLGSALGGIALKDERDREIKKAEDENKRAMIKNLIEDAGTMKKDSFIASLNAISGITDAEKKSLNAIFQAKTDAERIKLKKELDKITKQDREKVLDKALSQIKREDAPAGLESQVYALYDEIDNRIGAEYSDNSIQSAISLAISDTIKNNKEALQDEDIMKSNVIGNFYKNLLVISSQGLIPKEGKMNEETSDKEHAGFAKIVYSQPEGTRKQFVDSKLKEWRKLKDSPGFGWSDNFIGWAFKNAQELNKVQQ